MENHGQVQEIVVRNDLLNRREADLLAVLINGEKYGRAIREAYFERTGVQMPLGSLYTTLDRMEELKLIKSRMGESVSERGGNRRKFYKISAGGIAKLNSAAAFFGDALVQKC